MGYIVNWENLTQECIFVAKQGLMKNKKLKTKKEKMRNEKWVCRPNKALTDWIPKTNS